MMRALAASGVSPRKASAIEVVRALSGARRALERAAAGEGRGRADDALRRRAAASQKRISNRARATDMTVETLRAIAQPLGAYGDVVMSLEGLGDALLHPDIMRLVAAAKDAGILGMHVATDGRAARRRLVRAPGRRARRRAERRPSARTPTRRT